MGPTMFWPFLCDFICSTILCLYSLCNTKATSEQTLLLHADGKKHKAKARAFHASKQQPLEKEGSVQQTTTPSEIPSSVNGKSLEESKVLHTSETTVVLHDKFGEDNGTVLEKKKRKHDECENGIAVQATSQSTVEGMKKIKWKKLIKSTLKSVCIFIFLLRWWVSKFAEIWIFNAELCFQGYIVWSSRHTYDYCFNVIFHLKQNSVKAMKMKKLKKLVIRAVKEMGIEDDENVLTEKLQQKVMVQWIYGCLSPSDISVMPILSRLSFSCFSSTQVRDSQLKANMFVLHESRALCRVEEGKNCRQGTVLLWQIFVSICHWFLED